MPCEELNKSSNAKKLKKKAAQIISQLEGLFKLDLVKEPGHVVVVAVHKLTLEDIRQYCHYVSMKSPLIAS